MTLPFQDHFSKQAAEYAKYRPRYPSALFAWLSSIVPEHDCAWDGGTGNGQAAVALAPYFNRVIATEPSERQLANAIPDPCVEYRRETAERTSIPAQSIDLITVAQAVHWFDFERFYAEVRRVAKAEAVVAVWCYHLTQVNPAIDAIIYRYYSETVGPFWPHDRITVEQGYRTIPFPFEEMAPPEFRMTADWTLDQLLGYIGTWSATQRFMERNGIDPLVELDRELAAAWGPRDQAKRASWPLHMRVGRVGN